MTRTQGGFFVDVWVGFHVLFFAVLFSVALMILDVFSPSSSVVVTGPLTLALAVVVGRSSVRLVRNLTSA